MPDYPLKDVARFAEYAGGHCGLIIHCPNCGLPGSVFFKELIGGHTAEFQKAFTGKLVWDRQGDTLETITLSPSVQMNGHFHSWIREGKLCVDSEFSCTPSERN